jgi:hypothetical protein
MSILGWFKQTSGPSADTKKTIARLPRPALRETAAGGIPTTIMGSGTASSIDPFLQARLDLADAENEVTEISRNHLATLLALPPRPRLSHLADPELTPTDKSALENSVRSLLPRSTEGTLRAFDIAGTLRRRVQRCGYKCLASVVVLAFCGLTAGIAWRNTGERVIVSTQTWLVDWHLPDGSILHGGWKAGFPVIAMRPWNGTVTLRYWLPGQGYADTEVDQDWLVKHSSVYVVAPTGGTAAVNPAKRGSL